ncbi:TPA: hypothetical protein ACP6IR_002001 [Clostridioides difficile]|nr:hypothetical protein [Clostridioides difficile]
MAHLKFNMSHAVSTLKNYGIVNIVYMHPNGKVKAVRYDDEKLLLNDLEKYDGKCNIYITLNPINSNLDIEVSNTFKIGGKSISDKDIARYELILIDLDPIRKSKTSSTDEEHNDAKVMLEEIKAYLVSMGVDGFIIASSGNGWHLLLRVNIDNNVDNVNTVKIFLKSLHSKFSNDKVKVDTSTYNPARLTRVYGTMTCKGTNTEDRPHRRSAIIDMGNHNKYSSIDDLQRIINDLGYSSKTKRQNIMNIYAERKDNDGLTLEKCLINAGINISHKKIKDDQTIYVLERCPFKDHHTDKSAYVIEYNNGGIHAGCHHESCSNNNWNTLKELYGINYSGKNTDNIAEKDRKKETQEEIILDIVEELEIYKANMDDICARIYINGRAKGIKVGSETFKQWIILEYNRKTGRIPSSENISKVVSLLKAKGMFMEPVEIGQRCIAIDDTIYYDLANSKGEVVKISKNGWSITTDLDCLFDSNNLMKAQVRPVEYDNLNILDKYFRYKDKNHLILQKVALVSLFIESIVRPICVLHGEKGSSKTSTMKLIRNIVDPSMVSTTSLPRNIDDLAVALNNQYLICFDNIDRISNDISDLLCTATTGGGYAKRKLYTDSEQIIMNFRKGMILNGINIVATRSDLLDRCILMELDRIPQNERKLEHELNKMIENDMPKILGAIFTTISKAMDKYNSIELDNLGRLADFTKWGYAIAEVSGIGGDVFLEAYLNNQNDSNYEAILSNPVGSSIIKLIKDKEKWEGTPTKLLSELNSIAEEDNININNNLWPKAPNALSRRLNEIRSNFQDIGINIQIVKGVERKVIISKQK